MLLFVASPADAQEPEPDESVGGAVEAVVAAAPELSSEALTTESDGSSAMGNAEGVSIEVPFDAGEPITLTDGETSVGVELPYGDLAAPGELSEQGMVAFDNENNTSTVTALRDDGSIQVNVVIDGIESPREFPYQFDLPPGTEIEQVGESILFINGSELVAGLAPAWAKDADGREVPTWYEVREGGLVVQVVAHGPQYAYPIVADPWIGMWLFKDFSSTRKVYNNKKVYSAMLTPWGWSVYTGVAGGGGPVPLAAGYKIVREVGWSEWKQKLVGSKPAISLEQQYVCHARFGYVFWKAGFHWDLETARSSKPDWTSNPKSHQCNWK